MSDRAEHAAEPSAARPPAPEPAESSIPRPAASPEDAPLLVRPYIARHGEQTRGSEVTIPPPDTPKRTSRTGRHGFGSSDVLTTEIPAVDVAEADQSELDGPGGRSRRFLVTGAVAVLVLVAIAVTTLVVRSPGPDLTTPPTTGPSATGEPFPGPSVAPVSVVPDQRASTRAAEPTTAPTSAKPAGDRTGSMVSALAGNRCADLRNDREFAGASVQIYACNNTAAQLWTFRTDGTVRVHDSWCLAPEDGRTSSGTDIVIDRCGRASVQRWQVAPGGRVVNQRSGLCLTVPRDSTSVVQLTLQTCTGATGQRWTTP